MLIRLTSFVLLGTLAGAAFAQQYRWIDDKGGMHYTDTPPPPSAKNAEKKNLKGNSVAEQESYQLTQARSRAPVTLYSHPDCQDVCQTARNVLNRRGVPFTEISVTDKPKLDDLRKVSGGERVPVLLVGGHVERTPTAGAFDSALDAAGYPAAGVLKPREQR